MSSDRDLLSLLDWRRRVAGLYAEVRARRAHDPVGAWEHWATERERLFAAHPQSPLHEQRRGDFRGLPLFDYERDLVFTAHVAVDDSPQPVQLGEPFLKVGAVSLPLGRLDVYWLDAYCGGLFLPFRDATAGRQTFGGGRYLLDTAKGADLGEAPDGALVLDFNFAYNPSCAYSPTWSCPLPPTGNVLSVPVEAGEQAFPD